MEQIKEKNGSGSYDLDADMRIRLNNMETVYYTGKNSNEIFEKIDKINRLRTDELPITYSTEGSFLRVVSTRKAWDLGHVNVNLVFFDVGSKFSFDFTTGDYFFTDSVGFHHGGLVSENLALVLERVAHDNQGVLSEGIGTFNSYRERFISEQRTRLTRDEFNFMLNLIHAYVHDTYYQKSIPRVSKSIAVVREIERTIFGKMLRMESPNFDGN